MRSIFPEELADRLITLRGFVLFNTDQSGKNAISSVLVTRENEFLGIHEDVAPTKTVVERLRIGVDRGVGAEDGIGGDAELEGGVRGG